MFCLISRKLRPLLYRPKGHNALYQHLLRLKSSPLRQKKRWTRADNFARAVKNEKNFWKSETNSHPRNSRISVSQNNKIFFWIIKWNWSLRPFLHPEIAGMEKVGFPELPPFTVGKVRKNHWYHHFCAAVRTEFRVCIKRMLYRVSPDFSRYLVQLVFKYLGNHGPAVQLFPAAGEAEPRLTGEGHHEYRAAFWTHVLPEPVPAVSTWKEFQDLGYLLFSKTAIERRKVFPVLLPEFMPVTPPYSLV